MPTDEDYLWVSFVRWRVCAMKRLESDRPGWSLSQGVDRGSMREEAGHRARCARGNVMLAGRPQATECRSRLPLLALRAVHQP